MKILLVQESDWLIKGPHPQHHLAEKLMLKGHIIRVIDFEVLWKTNENNQIFSKRKFYPHISKLYADAFVDLIRPGIMKLRIPGFDYLSLLFTHNHEIKRQIQEFAPDVIIGLGILNNFLAMRLAKKNGIPFICYWLDLWHMLIPFKYFRTLGKIIERITLKKSDCTLSTNKMLRTRLVEMGAPPEKSYVLRHAFDPNRFNPSISGQIIKDKYGILPNDIVITFIGRLSRIVGALEIVNELSKGDYPNLKFLIVGSGSRESELRYMQEEFGLQKKVIITGRRPYDEIPYLIQASDICLLPYLHTKLTNDIVPLKIFDYMAMGKPIISTSLPGMVEEFGDDSGIIFVDKPESVPREAIKLKLNGKLHDLGMKARKSIDGRDWDSATCELEEIIQKVVADNKRVKN